MLLLNCCLKIINCRKVQEDQMTSSLWRPLLITHAATTVLFWIYSKLSIAPHSNVPGVTNSPRHLIHFCVCRYPFPREKPDPSLSPQCLWIHLEFHYVLVLVCHYMALLPICEMWCLIWPVSKKSLWSLQNFTMTDFTERFTISNPWVLFMKETIFMHLKLQVGFSQRWMQEMSRLLSCQIIVHQFKTRFWSLWLTVRAQQRLHHVKGKMFYFIIITWFIHTLKVSEFWEALKVFERWICCRKSLEICCWFLIKKRINLIFFKLLIFIAPNGTLSAFFFLLK